MRYTKPTRGRGRITDFNSWIGMHGMQKYAVRMEESIDRRRREHGIWRLKEGARDSKGV